MLSRRHSPPLPLIMIFRIGHRHIRCATSRVIVQIRRPMITMRRLTMILLLSTQSHIIVLVLFLSLVLVHLKFPRTILLETLQTSHLVPSPMRLNPTPPWSLRLSLTSLSPLSLPTSTVILSLAMRLLLNRASPSSLLLLCTTLHRYSIRHILITALSSDVGPVIIPSSPDSTVKWSGYLPHAQGFASLSPAITRTHTSPQDISDLDAHITAKITTIHAQRDTLNVNITIPMEVTLDSTKSSPSIPDMAAKKLRPVDNGQGLG
jgi:hypothetical protein